MGLSNFLLTLKGGPGSGNHGHGGRPGKRGGSSIGKSSIDTLSLRNKVVEREGYNPVLVNPENKEDLLNFIKGKEGKRNSFLYDPKTGNIAFGIDSAHFEVADVLTHNPRHTVKEANTSSRELQDKTVRGFFRMQDSKSIFKFNPYTSASKDDLDKAYKNIYKAMNKLSKFGFEGTPYAIEGGGLIPTQEGLI